MKLERIALDKFGKKAFDRSQMSKINGGTTTLTAGGPTGNPDRDVYDCTGDNYDWSHYDYYGRLTFTKSSPNNIW